MMNTNDPYAMLAQMDPAVLDELMRLGTVDERQALLEQQMAQAQALRKPDGQQHYSALGGALGGLNSAINNIYGAYQQGQLSEQQMELMKQKDAGRVKYARALPDLYGRSPVQTDVPADVIPASPFAF